MAKRQWPRAQAGLVADGLVRLLAPTCDRIRVAGSIRRKKALVGDIELVCIPKVVFAPVLFGEPTTNYDALDEKVHELINNGTFKSRGAVGPKNKFLVHQPSGIAVDIFSTTADNYGMALVVRTGSAKFNIKVMSRFRRLGMRGHAYGGVTDQNGEEVPCPDEATVFRLLGWDYVEPQLRR